MGLYDCKQGCCIPLLNDLHVAACRSGGCVHHAKYPNVISGWVSLMMLYHGAIIEHLTILYHTMYIAPCFYITVYFIVIVTIIPLLLLYPQSLQPPSTITFLLTLHLCTNRDSSICTTIPFPPSIAGPSLNSRVHIYCCDLRYLCLKCSSAYTHIHAPQIKQEDPLV